MVPELPTEAILTQHWGMPAELHLGVGLQQPRHIGLILRCSTEGQRYKVAGQNLAKQISFCARRYVAVLCAKDSSPGLMLQVLYTIVPPGFSSSTATRISLRWYLAVYTRGNK